jgi:hypothetical protein
MSESNKTNEVPTEPCKQGQQETEQRAIIFDEAAATIHDGSLPVVSDAPAIVNADQGEFPPSDVGREYPISRIKIGNRCRRELGDIDELARSIAGVGLLHPIPVRPDGLLIAGQRRLAACKKLGWHSVPVHVVDLQLIGVEPL